MTQAGDPGPGLLSTSGSVCCGLIPAFPRGILLRYLPKQLGSPIRVPGSMCLRPPLPGTISLGNRAEAFLACLRYGYAFLPSRSNGKDRGVT